MPSVDVGVLASSLQKDFGSIDQIRTVGMTDDIGGRFDVIVIGSKPHDNGWRVKVFSVSHHRITVTWDSAVMAREAEYKNSGPRAVTVEVRDYDYDILIGGCVPHMCGGRGINGYLMFSGQSGKTSKVKVVTQDLDKPDVDNPKYSVTFSGNISEASRSRLREAICSDSNISKSGLPFQCGSH